MLKLLFAPSALLLVALFRPAAQDQPTPQPQSPATQSTTPRVNPIKATPESQAHAKKVYSYDCSMCHGDKGDGKGDVVDSMKLTLRDYTKPDSLKDMTDGELFDVIKDGKGQMPGEGGRCKPDDIWNLVIYIRSMSKKSAT